MGAHRWLPAALVAFWVVAACAVAGSVAVLFDLSPRPGVVVITAVAIGALVLAGLRLPPIASRRDRVIVHGVRWPSLAVAVGAVYVTVVVGLGGRPAGGERVVLLLAMLAAVVAASLVPRLLRRLDEVANQLAYGRRRAPAALVDDFTRRLARPLGVDEQLLQLAESLRDGLGMRRVDLWVAVDGGVLERTVSLPHRGPSRLVLDPETAPVVARAPVSGDAWIRTWVPALGSTEGGVTRLAPATSAGELHGVIVVERPTGAPAPSATEDAVLADIATQLALALQTMKLEAALRRSLVELQRHADELAESRARVVVAADTERRRIERDLHDGAQQRLSALQLKVGIAERALAGDAGQAAALVADVKRELREVATEIRALAHGIYPPALEAGGLLAALAEVGERSVLDVVVGGDVARYDAAMEAAVYFCCVEAIHNAEKHAGASAVFVDFTADDTELSFTVRDDGNGFDGDGAPPGSGLNGMRDRIGALGGELTIRSASGAGTLVAGCVPLGRVA